MADELTDEEFDKRYGSPVSPGGSTAVKADPAAAYQEDRDLTDAEFDKAYSPDGGLPSQDILYGHAAPWVKYYGEKWEQGEASVTRGVAGMRAIQGAVQYEQIADDVQTEKLKKSTDTFQRNLSPWDVRQWVGSAAESLPFMREVFAGGVKGGAVGGAAGAGAAFVGGQLGPQIALPEELVTVPGGAALGARWGFRAGAFTTSAKLMSGQLYLDLRDSGVSHDTARTVGVAGGAIEGLIETVQLGQLGGAARKEFVNQLGSQAGRNALLKFMREYVKDVGLEVGEEELQSVTELVAQGVSGFVDKNPDVVPTADEIKQKLLDTFVQSAQASAVLVGGSQVAGAGGGATVQAISSRLLRQQQIEESVSAAEGVQRGAEVGSTLAKRLAAGRTNLQQAARIFAEALNQPQVTEEEKAAPAASVDEILDSLQVPATDQDVKPLIARVLKTVGEALEAAPAEETAQNEVSPDNFSDADFMAADDTIYADGPAGFSEPNTDLPTPELKARAAKVDDDIRTLDGQIRQAERMIDERDVEGKTAARDEAQAKYDQATRTAERLEKKYSDKERRGTDSQAVLDKLEAAYQAEADALAALRQAKRALSRTIVGSTTAIQNRLDKLYEQRATLETERALLQEGLLSPEEIKKSQVKLTAGQVTAMRAKAVSKILKAFARGQREGVTFTRSEVRDIQGDIISIIRESELNREDRGRFLADIRKIQTEAQLLRALPKIQQRIDLLVEAEQRRQVARKMNRALKQTELQKSGKRAVGKFGSADTQRILDIYRKAITDPEWRTAAIARGLDALSADVAKAAEASGKKDPTIQDFDSVPDAEILETLIAQRVGVYEAKSVEDQQALLEEIQAIMAGGRAEKLDKKLAFVEERKAAIATALESIQGNKPLDSLNPANSKMALNTLQNKLRRLSIDRFINSWDGLMVILSQHDAQEKLRGVADVFEAVRNEAGNQKKYREQLIDTLLGKVDKNPKVVLDRMVSGSRKEKMGTYTNQDGESVPLYISRNEAIKLWMQMGDPDLEAGLKKGNQYTFPEDVSPTQKSTYTLLQETLTPEDKAMAEALKDFYRAYYGRVNAEWEDETGASLGKNENYSGYARRLGTVESGTVGFFHEQFSRSSVKPSSTISRVANAKGLALSDAFMDALKHVQDFEHWIAWRKRDKIVRAIFANANIRNAITLKYGQGMMRTIDDRYNDMIGTRQEQIHDALKWLDRIRLNAGTAFVGGKALSFFKQMTAIVNFLLDVNPIEMAEGMIDFALHPVKAIQTMEQSPLLKARVETFDRDLMEALTRDDIKTLKRRPKLNDMMLWFTKYGDRATVWAGGWAVYKAALKKTKDPHKAMIAFEKSFNSTQQSGTVDSMSQLEKAGQFGKILTLFTKQNLQMLEREANGIRKLMAIPNAKNALEAARRIAVIHTAAALFQAVGSTIPFLFGDDDKKTEEEIKVLRALILGPLAGLGLLGDTFNATLTVITNWGFGAKERVWKPSFLPAEALTHTYSLFKRLFDGLTKDDGLELEDIFAIMKDYARGPDLFLPPELGGGLPKEPLIKFLQWGFVGDEEDKK